MPVKKVWTPIEDQTWTPATGLGTIVIDNEILYLRLRGLDGEHGSIREFSRDGKIWYPDRITREEVEKVLKPLIRGLSEFETRLVISDA